MAFFKSFQSNLPSVNISSMLESVTTGVGELAGAVSDATSAVSNQVSEQVTTIIAKAEEQVEAEGGAQEESGAESGAESASASQQEWEWRDGGWRVKRTPAELEEEERKKQEQREWEEKREEKMRQKRERQLEREAQEAQRRKETCQDEPEEDEEEAGERPKEDAVKAHVGGAREKDSTQVEEEEEPAEEEGQGDECDEDAPPSPEPVKAKAGAPEKKDKEEASAEKEGKVKPAPSPTTKETIPEKKKAAKDNAKKSKKDAEKKKSKKDTEKKKKKKSKKDKKKKSSKEGGSSESEEEKVPDAAAVHKNHGSVWNSRHKHSTEPEGYSSDASSRQANHIQRIKRDHSLNELQPPPYQDEDTLARVSRSRSSRAVRRGSSLERSKGSSEASVDQDTESYLNKGYEEDVPSDSTAVLGAEDGSGPMLPSAYEPEPLAKYGTLDVAFEYDSGEQWLAVTVTAATDIPALKQTGNIAWQVHLVLLPTKKQRAKTGVQKGPCPVFTETFRFLRVEQDALGDYAVRFRLYSVRRMKKEKVLGEKIFYLTKLNLQGKMALPVTLEPGSELTGCGSLVSVSRSAGALSYRSSGDSLPEILLGLIYNAATGRLSAEVIQGSHFRTTASDKPTNGLFCCIKHFVGGQLYIMRDTYVKLTMLDSKGKEMSKCKTAVCRGQPNPTYKESFVFQVALFQLSEVSLVVSVFCCRSSMKPRERLGWVSLGHSSTGEDQQSHWTEMKEAEGQQVCHWHTLSDT